jgi:GT2 family glycosyltransferase
MTTSPDVAVCVSTRNRVDRLRRLLAQLERQTLPADRFEVVVVDDGSADTTWQVLEQQAAAGPLQLRPLRNDESAGPAAGRNRAWRAARAPLVAFTDDDCMPSPTWLQAGVAAMSQQPVLAAGAIRPTREDEARLGPFSRFLIADAGIAVWCATANLFIRREHLEHSGGFDESFRNAAGEDTDLGLRITGVGVPFVFLPEAVVYHDVERSSLLGLIRDQRRWADVAAVIARHPEARRLLLHRRYFWKPTHPKLLLLLVGAAAAARRPAALALAVPWVHERTCAQPRVETVGENLAVLAGTLAVDCAELIAMVRGSIRHRTLVL